MTPESKVKDKVKKMLHGVGAYYTMPVTGGYGNSGVPDFIVCLRGRFVGIECKAGSGKPTALQYKHLKDIQVSGGISLVVNESNLGQLQEILNGNEADPYEG